MQQVDLLYLASHIAQALATDARTHMLDVSVCASNDCIYLSGTVTSSERLRLVEEVARERAQGMRLVNALSVARYSEPPSAELLG